MEIETHEHAGSTLASTGDLWRTPQHPLLICGQFDDAFDRRHDALHFACMFGIQKDRGRREQMRVCRRIQVQTTLQGGHVRQRAITGTIQHFGE